MEHKLPHRWIDPQLTAAVEEATSQAYAAAGGAGDGPEAFAELEKLLVALLAGVVVRQRKNYDPIENADNHAGAFRDVVKEVAANSSLEVTGGWPSTVHPVPPARTQ